VAVTGDGGLLVGEPIEDPNLSIANLGGTCP
jgi:hypothetical protein